MTRIADKKQRSGPTPTKVVPKQPVSPAVRMGLNARNNRSEQKMIQSKQNRTMSSIQQRLAAIKEKRYVGSLFVFL